MTHHRFAAALAEPTEPAAQAISMSGFVAVPLELLGQSPAAPASWQCQLYQMAFAQAQAVVQPSWIERDVLAVWN